MYIATIADNPKLDFNFIAEYNTKAEMKAAGINMKLHWVKTSLNLKKVKEVFKDQPIKIL